MKEPKWSVELWDINGGGTKFFNTKAEAKKYFNSLKRVIKRDYQEYEWIEVKDGSELMFKPKCEGYGEMMLLGDMRLLD